jgi:hypothetical protein
MPNATWTIEGRGFTNCNCAYGCPCQFNALPTHGECQAVVCVAIDEGHHGNIRLDGLKFATIAAWPGAIDEGKGQVVPIIDRKATPEQRESLLRIMSGEDTEPGATIFQVFSATFDTVHEPIFADIEFDVNVDERTATLKVPGVIEGRGEPIRNPVTGNAHQARIDLPQGFEYTRAEVGRGWATTYGAIKLSLNDSHAHFAHMHMTQDGVVR